LGNIREVLWLTRVEILNFGDELLMGRFSNTNGFYLAKRLTAAGAMVTRITVVGDTLEAMVEGFRESIGRGPDFLITTGGLGPTFDDKTAEALSKATERPLQINEVALYQITGKYSELGLEMTPARRKMAFLPVGAEAVPNPVGVAPAIHLVVGTTQIYCLPGVPREMEKIFEQSILPVVVKTTEKVFHETSFTCQGLCESMFAETTEKLHRENPGIHIKSHPLGVGEEGKPVVLFHITCLGDKNLEEKMLRVVAELKTKLEELGGTITQQTRV